MADNDIVAGRVFRGKKRNGDPAKFFYLGIYELDAKSGEPVQNGTKTVGEGKEKKTFPQYKIAHFYKVAESSLMKVASDQSAGCNIYARR